MTICSYSIVIPCYRSGAWLAELIGRIADVMQSVGDSFEVILVNDASPDDTWKRIVEMANRYPFVRGIDLLFNTGQQRTIMCGLEHALGKFVVLMDDDFQHPPEEIPKLIEAMRTHPEIDCVMGVYEKKRHNIVRNMGSKLWGYITAKLYKMPTSVKLSSFRIMKHDLVEALCQHGTVSPVLGPLIFRTSRRVANVSVDHKPRIDGNSGYDLIRLVKIVLDNIFSASVLPLRMVTVLGLGSAAASIVLAAYYLVAYIVGWTQMPGFTTQLLLITFFGGMTLFSIGLVGEYLLRINEEVRKPPRFVVREIAGSRSDTERIAAEVNIDSNG